MPAPAFTVALPFTVISSLPAPVSTVLPLDTEILSIEVPSIFRSKSLAAPLTPEILPSFTFRLITSISLTSARTVSRSTVCLSSTSLLDFRVRFRVSV